MAVPRHLEEAARKLETAQRTIVRLRAEAKTMDDMRAWLEALSDATTALADIQSYQGESVHEKLHRLADHVKLRDLS